VEEDGEKSQAGRTEGGQSRGGVRLKVFVDANLIIYLNVGSTEEILDLWTTILSKHKPYTNPLVLDEVIWVSRKKYRVDEQSTIEFINREIIPYTTILSIGEEEYSLASKMILEYKLKPSDALHVATMKRNGITTIASEDNEFDNIPGIKRIWV
jgi:predicted nucleic acid-binding protein